jgi:hypothetical protein
MIPLIKNIIFSLIFASCLKAQVGEVVALSDIVGDTITSEENKRYRLFPFFKGSTLKYAIFYKYDSIYLLRGWFTDTIIDKKINREQFRRMKALAEEDSTVRMPSEKSSTGKPFSVKIWGGGGAFLFSDFLSIAVQNKNHLFSFRRGNFNFVNDIFGVSYYRVDDLALLYGLASRKKWICASASTGPALATIRRYHDSRFIAGVFGLTGSYYQLSEQRCLGLAFQLDIALTPLPFLGVGLYLTGNYNKQQTVAGLGILLRVGKLR